MSEFEFVFPLFALLVGLSVTEMLAGLAHALKSKRDIHVGWLTPLLGTLILINLAMFWQGSWDMRDSMTASSSSFLLVLAVGGTYFLAASLTFPSWDANVRDLDQHFMDNRKLARKCRVPRAPARGGIGARPTGNPCGSVDPDPRAPGHVVSGLRSSTAFALSYRQAPVLQTARWTPLNAQSRSAVNPTSL